MKKTANHAAQKNGGGRADRFWSAFLFTENGKPKSSLLVYTFCLSFVFAAVYVLCYQGAIELLTQPLSGLKAWASNLIISISATAVGVLICSLPHRFFRDKRLVFGAHLWLALYAVAVLATMLILLGGADGTAAFLTFFGWFIAIPVAMGCAVTGWLFRRDRCVDQTAEEEPEWKKYVNRR